MDQFQSIKNAKLTFLGCDIRWKELRTLQSGQLLDDLIIDTYLKRLPKRDDCHVMALSFSQSIASDQFYLVEKLFNEASKAYEILIPWYSHGHYVLVYIDMRARKMNLWDSFGHDNTDVLDKIEKIFENAYERKGKQWQQLMRHKVISKREQQNGTDCGIFLCMYAYAHAFGIDG